MVAGSLSLSAWLIASWPTLYWFDGYNRLAYREDLVVWRWLPLLQGVIVLASKPAPGPELVRGVLALLATAAIVGGHALCATLFDRRTGVLAALWIACNALFVVFAIVPYQEALFASLLLVALALAHRPAPAHGPAPLPVRGRLVLLALLANLICLTRYEGWLVPLAAAGEALLRAWRRRGAARALGAAFVTFLAFGGVLIVAWLAWADIEVTQHELSIAERLHPGAQLRLLRALAGELWREGGPVICLLGPLGLLHALRDRSARTTHLRVAAFFAPYAALIFLTDPLGAQRRAFLFMLLLVIGAAHGGAAAARALALRLRSPAPRVQAPLGLALLALAVAASGVRRGIERVGYHSTRSHDNVRVQRAAAWLRPQLGARDLLIACSELERRVAATHAWIPVERVRNGAREPDLTVERLGELVDDAGSVHLLLTAELKAGLALALPGLVEDAPAAGLVLERVPPDLLPTGAAEVWTARAR